MLQTGCGNHLKWCAISWATDKDMHFSHTGLFLRPRNFKSKKNLFPGLHSHLLRHLKFQSVIKVLQTQLKEIPIDIPWITHDNPFIISFLSVCKIQQNLKNWRVEQSYQMVRALSDRHLDALNWSTQKDFWKSLRKMQFWKSPQKMQFCTGWQVLLLRATRPLSDAQDPVCFQPTALACRWKVKVVVKM